MVELSDIYCEKLMAGGVGEWWSEGAAGWPAGPLSVGGATPLDK
jgi:hypothetical protein